MMPPMKKRPLLWMRLTAYNQVHVTFDVKIVKKRLNELQGKIHLCEICGNTRLLHQELNSTKQYQHLSKKVN